MSQAIEANPAFCAKHEFSSPRLALRTHFARNAAFASLGSVYYPKVPKAPVIIPLQRLPLTRALEWLFLSVEA